MIDLTIKDGGPAFPSPTANPIQDGQLSVRDYFAAQALPTVLREFFNGDEWDDYADVSKSCYLAADAMLAERAK